MTKGKFLRRALVATLAFTAACGDSTGPNVELNDDQVDDMMAAFSEVGAFSFLGLAPTEPAENALMAVMTIDDTAPCPNGGTIRVQMTLTQDEETGDGSATVTQSLTGCKGTSSTGRLWTFDGNPNITTTLSATEDPETGATTLTGSQVGGIRFSSNLGTGTCSINVSLSAQEDANGNGSASVTGSVCGRTIDFQLEISGAE